MHTAVVSVLPCQANNGDRVRPDVKSSFVRLAHSCLRPSSSLPTTALPQLSWSSSRVGLPSSWSPGRSPGA